ncbi:uncharacterized protein LOC143349979 isoform X3 [Colletes latitarsis]|uniref:uncharacterized protein LOC143349979 isoform X3 n=1 Tax=Colletes latitarsis TaxID=2605962 RepID=UPI0040374B4F
MTETSLKQIQNSTHKKDYEKSQPIRIAQLLKEEETLKRTQKNSAHKKDYEKSQPIRIVQLFKEEETLKRTQKNSAHKKDYEKSQPIRIAQLLKEQETLKKTQKNSERKKAQPERLGPLSSTKCTGKDKPVGIKKQNQSLHAEKRVRRNLNFNEISDSILENNENTNKSNKFIINEPISKDILTRLNKKSLLLPPNTIKHEYIQKCTKNVDEHSKRQEVSEKHISTVKKSDARICSIMHKENREWELNGSLLLNNELPGKTSVQFKCIKTSNGCETAKVSNSLGLNIISKNQPQCSETPSVKKFVQSSRCTTYQEITVNNEDQLCIQDNLIHEVLIPNKINSKNEVFDKSEDQNLCNDLQDTKLVVAKNDNGKPTSSEMIYVDKSELIHLEYQLKNLLNTMEDKISEVNSTLMCITKLLSVNNEQVIQPNIYIEKQDCSESGKVHSMMLDKEVEETICCKLLQQTEENLEAPISHDPQICVNSVKRISLNKSNKSNKENHEVTIENNTPTNADESFLNLEEQFNITCEKFVQAHCIQQKTPTVTRYKQKRSLREYMALKSSMRFLETPDGKGFKSTCRESNIDTSILNKSYISNKVLLDIQNLYSDSPVSD